MQIRGGDSVRSSRSMLPAVRSRMQASWCTSAMGMLSPSTESTRRSLYRSA